MTPSTPRHPARRSVPASAGQRSGLVGALPWMSLVLAAVLATGCTSSAASTVEEVDRIAEVMGLEEGMRIADVGAGDGEWSLELARRLGSEGRLWSTEIDPDDVEDLERTFERQELDNAVAVLGSDVSTGLPDGCCDAILLRLVYHHFTDPQAMRDSLRKALRPGGRLVIVDIDPQEHWRELDGVPERGGHGITADDLVRELTRDGFEVVSRHDDWPDEEDHYCVVFQACG